MGNLLIIFCIVKLPILELNVVYNISIHPFSLPPEVPSPAAATGGTSRSVGKKMVVSGWGIVNMFKVDDAIAAEGKFQAEQRLIHYIPPEARPELRVAPYRGRSSCSGHSGGQLQAGAQLREPLRELRRD